MKKKVIVLIVILLLCAALLVWCLWANTALTTTVIDVQAGEGLPAEFEGFRIAHISDLHNAVFGEENEKLLTLLREAEPDIIAVTGDLIDSRHTDVDAAVAFIASATETAPVYYVTGNHESRLDFENIEPRLTDAGAQVLRNSAVYIERGGGSIQLAGIDGGVHRHVHPHPAGMTKTDRLAQAGGVKIPRAAPCVEARKSQINRVGAAVHGGAEHFFTAHRGQDLNSCHSSPLLVYGVPPGCPSSGYGWRSLSFSLSLSWRRRRSSCSRRAAASRRRASFSARSLSSAERARAASAI